ncbi:MULTISPECIES: ParB/RepB/Spo0J family partition protein [Vibrio]|uniref:Probable chromosome-partitioning protein ParB n=1 Tax=Vibrio mediterranei TaxID=689 RepID=A0A2C9P9P5_9VIBR|nr:MULTISPECIES: ParB/RepB/Spo0J family partition protein [Vibrio]ASI89438.1 chromosome partitioning protein ParB [Vibrio mediterranei]AYV21404.1 ParB/RepB/Spo0J family partition protein [Vibrio mediterranei]EDL52702.1 ParB family protein [Vibrio mediterranei AK1]KFA99821.1 chromosome partitioning protein ParB [Vibrio sp. ER1A]MCF4176053.1 ParB/RepB/Spo0J family partition protein [Vibrio sp. McD22-P3]
MSKRGLGKGLDALLSTSSIAREKQQVATQSQSLSTDGDLAELSINSLRPGIYQPRKDMAPEALEELAASIQSQGIIQPIVVRSVGHEQFEIIAGERRWRAARQAGLKMVPCLVKNVQDRAAVAMALIENIQREDLNAIEEAQALERLQDEFELTHQQVADVIGKSRTAVSNLLRLNQLEPSVKKLVEAKQIDMGHARALLALEGEVQCEVADTVAKKQLTVRQTEDLVKKCLKPNSSEKKQSEDRDAKEISHRLSEILGAKVSLVRNASGKAKVTISLDEPHKLEQLIAKLES